MCVMVTTAGIVISALHSLADVNLDQGLVAYYPFDGNTNDMSGNGHHGVVHGNLSFSSDAISGSSAYFNGEDAYIFLGSISNPVTVSAWIKIPERQNATIFMKGLAAECVYEPALKLYDTDLVAKGYGCGASGRFGTYYYSSSFGSWHHVTLIYNPDTNHFYGEFYVDGQKKGQANLYKRWGPHDFVIGAYIQYSDTIIPAFKGFIDEFRIYNRVLNLEEIKALAKSTWHVSPSGNDNNSGTSWDQAFATLGHALQVAKDGDEIVLAQGIYQENGLSIPKSKQLIIRGTNPSDPNVVENTVIDGNGQIIFWAVSYAKPTEFRGITFKNGNSANGDFGGVIKLDHSGLIFKDCIFKDNQGVNAAAVWVFASDAKFIRCVFQNNHVSGIGGAIYARYGSATYENCRFTGNSATEGGAIYNRQTSPTISSCWFENNSALQGSGGAMVNFYSSHSKITNTVFWNNRAKRGGAIFNGMSSNPQMTNCTFINNQQADQYQCTLYNELSHPKVYNSIIWNAQTNGNQICNTWQSSTTVVNSDIQGGYDGEGVINEDPLFVDMESGDFHINEDSPCIDTGTRTAPNLPETDIDSEPRVCGQNVDMGVDELCGGLHIEPPFVEFGQQEIGQCSSSEDIVITNMHWIPVTIKSIALTEQGIQDRAPFYISDDQCTGQTLYDGDTCPITVSFCPDEKGIVSDELKIYTDDPRNQLLSIGFLGEGIQPLFDVTVHIDPEQAGSVSGQGITCPNDCTETYPKDTFVTLTPEPATEDWQFVRWDGFCTDYRQEDNSCQFSIEDNVDTTAVFECKPISATTITVDKESVMTNEDYLVCWNNIDRATNYFLIESSDPEFSDYQYWNMGTELCKTFNHATPGTYYYKVQVRRSCGSQSDFSSVISVVVNEPPANHAPNQPATPEPEDGAINVNYTDGVTLSWSCTDPDDDPLTYKLLFGEYVDGICMLQQQENDLYQSSIHIPNIKFSTLYCWRIIACDQELCTNGPVWSFTTAAPPPVQLSVVVEPVGSGTVIGEGISCPGDCSELVSPSSIVELEANAANGYELDHWEGCSETNGDHCIVIIEDQNVEIRTHFRQTQPSWYDITENIDVNKSRTLYDRINRCFFVLLDLTNLTNESITGPVRMVLIDNTIPLETNGPGLNPDGYTLDGHPYFIIIPEGQMWTANYTVEDKRLDFVLRRARLNFSLKFEKLANR